MTAATTEPARRPVARPRLLARLLPARIAVIEAGSGFGKTTLARACAHELGQAWSYVGLVPRDADPSFLVRRLARSLRGSGLSDAATLVQQAGDPDAAIEALVDALPAGADPVLLVVDEVQHAGGEGGRLLTRLAAELPAGHRLWLLGRRLPDACAPVRLLHDAVAFDGRDLAFTAQETAELLAAAGREHLTPGEAEALARVTGGWAVALVLAATAVDGDGAASPVAEGPALLRSLVEQGLQRLEPPDREAVAQLARLPLLLPALVEEVGGSRMLDAAVGAGLPFVALPDGQWVLPDPVREYLGGLAPLDRQVAHGAAAEYVRIGEPMLAFELLAPVDDRAAASLLADLRPEQVETLDVLDLSTAVEALSPAAVESHPLVLVHLARACEPAAQVARRHEALTQALRLAGDDARLRREVEAELARDLARDMQPAEAEALAESVLAATETGEVPTRARALDVLGRVKAWRRDAASLAAAEPLLEEAYRLCLSLGRRSWAAQVAMPLAIHVHYARGHHAAAIARIDEALAHVPATSRHRAVMLTFRADVLIDCGRSDEAEATLEEARELAARVRDARVLAYVWWSWARAAAYRDDAAATLEALRRAEEQHGDWFAHDTGAELLADAGELLGRVGEEGLAWEYLARAEARHPQAERACALVRAVLTARFGDPREAEERLAGLAAEPHLEPRERWRLELLRALAARRRGDPEAEALADGAFALAAAMGSEALPFARESRLVEELRREQGVEEPVGVPRLRLLGGFEASRSGQALALPPGLPTQLVKLLACSGRRLPGDAVVESLWPQVEPASGRKRLRNVLNRLRDAAGDLVIRDGDALALAPGLETDADEFERAAAHALASPHDDGAAGAALARYGGELLPDDRYEPWSAEPRERLARRQLALLDLLADRAEAEGEVDEALRLLERAIEADRLDESRYLRAAALLLTQGRRGRALEVLRTAAAALHELGLEPSDAHRALVRAARD
jgi:DNA-binding SARP family transcriptional activator/ATP/maltotriose-dependent transcriptional regulator MalT